MSLKHFKKQQTATINYFYDQLYERQHLKNVLIFADFNDKMTLLLPEMCEYIHLF